MNVPASHPTPRPTASPNRAKSAIRGSSGNFTRRAAFAWLGHPLVKSGKSARMCRNLNRFLCLRDAHGFIEIGFVRRIFADFTHPSHLIPVLLHAVWIDPVRLLETIILAISRPIGNSLVFRRDPWH